MEVVKLTQEQLKEVRNIFVYYVKEVQRCRVILDDADIIQDNINLETTPSVRWHSVFSEAEKQQKLFRLALAFPSEYPHPTIERLKEAIKSKPNWENSPTDLIEIISEAPSEPSKNIWIDRLADILNEFYQNKDVPDIVINGDKVSFAHADGTRHEEKVKNFLSEIELRKGTPRLIFELFFQDIAGDKIEKLFESYIKEHPNSKVVNQIINEVFEAERYAELVMALKRIKQFSNSERLKKLVSAAEAAKRSDNLRRRLKEIIEKHFRPSESVSHREDISYEKNKEVINFDWEIRKLLDNLEGNRTESILYFFGKKNVGKSTLLKEFIRILEHNEFRTLRFDCERQTDISKLILRLDDELFEGRLKRSKRLKNFDPSSMDASFCQALLEGISDACQNKRHFLVIFDLDKASEKFKSWFEDILINNYNKDVLMTIVASSNQSIDVDLDNELIDSIELTGFEDHTYLDYIEGEMNIKLNEEEQEHLKNLIKRYEGLPGQIAPVIQYLPYVR